MPILKRTHKVTTWLHPRVAKPLESIGKLDVPWLVKKPIKPDKLLPRDGTWRWGGGTWRVAPFAGQTWWHCCLMGELDGKRVMFAGDNYQPATRWNGTGGFCAFNGSRFAEGFVRSAQLAIDWNPHLLCNGHSTYQTFHASQFKRIIKWAQRGEQVMQSLCPSGDLEKDYYLHPAKG